jgi:acyl-CoA thioester hydrolase
MDCVLETRFRVRYAETDQMGVVYYANYLVWMEVGRVEWCKSHGYNYREMEREDGILLAVAECRCRYLSPARFDDEIAVETRVEQADPRMVTFAYEIWLVEAGRAFSVPGVAGQTPPTPTRKLASGSTRHIILDRSFRRARLPAKYFEMFGIER